MKLKKLPESTDVTKIKIRLTQELKEYYQNYSSEGEEEMYLVGSVMGDWFISPDEVGSDSRRLYPMPVEVSPSDFLECEVIE